MKKNHENYIIIGLVIIALVVLIYSVVGFIDTWVIYPNKNPSLSSAKNSQIIGQSTSSGFKTISSGSTDPGEVSIELTPRKIKDGKLDVDIAINTHSVDLSNFDLKEITTLEYDGKIIKPISAPTLGGHHTTSYLVFQVDNDVDSFTIKIKGIPKVEERVFEW